MTLGMDAISPESSPAVQGLLADARKRIPRSLARREAWTELWVGGAFVVAAVALALALPTDRPLDWTDAALATLVLAITSRVVFEVGSCYTMPTQLVFVPMLFIIPPELVPLFVAAGLAVGKLAEVATGALAPGRIVKALGDSWFAIGPATLFALAGAPGPTGADWPLYLGALGSQFVIESLARRARDHLNGGASLREQLSESRWVYLVDSLLAPVGLAIGFAASEDPWTVTLVAPLAVLLHIFARERLARLESLIELNAAYQGTAYALGDVVQHNDAYTGRHSRSVVLLSLEVSDELGLDPRRRRNVELAALLHDVGKIAIPTEIINKPGTLDRNEWALVKTHTVEGQRVLDRIGGLMRSIGRVVRSSHERYDGDGYPDGLAGEDIPIESRIIFCCDAFSAMTTDRPYRRALSVEQAIAELEDNAGTQFDPTVAGVLVDRIRRAATRGRLTAGYPNVNA
jgi:HD-GYP domain-containing protein (c-di-GMP phosphodiesterase class II)